MKKLIFISIVFFVGILFACQKEEEKPYPGSCPNIDDQILWENNVLKYGEWELQKVGFDGYYCFVINEGIHLKNNCGWETHGNETGGVGKTYAVFNWDTAVLFRWAYGKFYSFTVDDKWKGETEKGIKMGDSLSKFLRVYDNFYVNKFDSTVYCLYDSTLKYPVNYVRARFTDKNPSKGRLKELVVNAKQLW